MTARGKYSGWAVDDLREGVAVLDEHEEIHCKQHPLYEPECKRCGAELRAAIQRLDQYQAQTPSPPWSHAELQAYIVRGKMP